VVELQQETKKQETLETVCVQAKSETQEEKECMNELECRVEDIFGKLPTTAQGSELPATEKIDQIVQAIDQYQKEIKTLCGQIRPTTPPAVKVQRKQEATVQLQELEKQVSTAADLLDKAAQLWTKLEEDPQVQQWDKEEERINAMIQEFKKQ
jgi:hypothetical protein